MTKQLARLHDGEQGLARGGLARGGLARSARKAWRSGPQAVGMTFDGTGMARSLAEVGAQACEKSLFEFVCAVPATWQCYPHTTCVTWQYDKRYCPCTSSVMWQYTKQYCLHASSMTWLHAPRLAGATSCDMWTYQYVEIGSILSLVRACLVPCITCPV